VAISSARPDNLEDFARRSRAISRELQESAAPLVWDTAHPLQPLTWIGGDAVVGEGAPWALAGGGAAQWLAPDWQGTIGDLPSSGS
jgi:hypothetical protein